MPFNTLIRNTIATMPDTFDSHDFIREFARLNQQAYIEALYERRDCQNPFNTLHTRIGRMLGNEFTDILEDTGDDERSPNIFGQSNYCTVWQKLG
jgi:hypothetical protein